MNTLKKYLIGSISFVILVLIILLLVVLVGGNNGEGNGEGNGEWNVLRANQMNKLQNLRFTLQNGIERIFRNDASRMNRNCKNRNSDHKWSGEPSTGCGFTLCNIRCKLTNAAITREINSWEQDNPSPS